MIGQENTMLWIGLYPERMGEAINRIGQFYLDCLKAQIAAADGLLDGMVIWGDVAYRRSMFFSPDYWRDLLPPVGRRDGARVPCASAAGHLSRVRQRRADLRRFHRDRQSTATIRWKPRPAWTASPCGKRYGHRFGVCGNSNIQVWETGDRDKIRREVLTKLNAAKGGGMIFQSDHSVSSNVSGHTYDYIVKLVREFGTYPLRLGEFDIDLDIVPRA